MRRLSLTSAFDTALSMESAALQTRQLRQGDVPVETVQFVSKSNKTDKAEKKTKVLSLWKP